MGFYFIFRTVGFLRQEPRLCWHHIEHNNSVTNQPSQPWQERQRITYLVHREWTC